MNLFRKHLQKAKEANNPLQVKDNETLAFEQTDSIEAIPAKFHMMVFTEFLDNAFNHDEVTEIINGQFPECPSDEIILITVKVNAMLAYVKEGTAQQERWNAIYENFFGQLTEYDQEAQDSVIRQLAFIAFHLSGNADQEALSEKYVYRLSLIENFVDFDNEQFATILEEVETLYQTQEYENNELAEENPYENLDGKFFVTFCALESVEAISLEEMNEVLTSVLREHDPVNTKPIFDYYLQIFEQIQSSESRDVARNSILKPLEDLILEMSKEDQLYWHSCFFYSLLSIKHIEEIEQICRAGLYFLGGIEKKLKFPKHEYIEMMDAVAAELGLNEYGDPISSEDEEDSEQEVETQNQEGLTTYYCYNCKAENEVPNIWVEFSCYNCEKNNSIVSPEDMTDDDNDKNADDSTPEFQLKCTICGSKDLAFAKKGFSWGKAIAVGVFTGGVGLLAGNIGKGNIIAKCNKCGNQWEPKPKK